ncbi:hypothetical protein [Enterobacter sichuanensis]|uniref:Protein secretion protein GspB n=1 Tax=Enterobacter sichuanensis TaxID=2071710 RepID=A0ABS6GB46_9ENTR|nr:hypothetical protein [Enterobacter sichuanensis]MBU5924033.1 hypothetical protein [Enterobacter sichuanensis]OZV02307.1 hypothetical protein CIW55_05960 [Enterobacter cloacae]PAO09907.1 hypothetical protein CIW58_18855 [Enterobacter cloacae]
MSTICLAAQRSYTTGEPVWFSWRLPSFSKMFSVVTLWFLGMCALIVAGLYAHVYWNLRHPAPVVKKVSVAKPETSLSDMHYIYVTKPFPHPQPKPQPVKIKDDLPPMENMPINSDENDWQQAPDGTLPDSPVTHDTSRDTLPGTEAYEQTTTSEDDGALKALFMQALKQQQDDMAKGKMPAPPVDETQNASPSVIKGDAGGD